MIENRKIILASRSKRRIELIKLLGLKNIVYESHKVDEESFKLVPTFFYFVSSGLTVFNVKNLITASEYDPIVKNAKSASEAATILNNNIFEMVGVIYSTKRPKADQSPYESIEAGLASCTGLSFMLIDACRSVGIPARFVGTPMWYNNSGNHSWVEIWDNGWHFTGAFEPTGERLNEGWFASLAARAVEGHPEYGIYAATWKKTGIFFPMDWKPGVEKYYAYDVTSSYQKYLDDNFVPLRIKVVGKNGRRKKVLVDVKADDGFLFSGYSNDERNDANDHLTLNLPIGSLCTINVNDISRSIVLEKEELIEFDL